MGAMSEDGHSTTLLKEDRLAAAWLWAALSLKLGRGIDVHKLLADIADPQLNVLVSWLEMTVSPEEKRVPLRWNMTLRSPPASVIPAVMFAVSQAVPADSDVEVWLDRIFHREHRSHPVRSMLARAEAARWRGDPGSERLWLERAARVRGLYDDYASTLLAHIAELR
jgi:hypothetical protein